MFPLWDWLLGFCFCLFFPCCSVLFLVTYLESIWLSFLWRHLFLGYLHYFKALLFEIPAVSVQCVRATLLISVDPSITIIWAQLKARGFARRFRVFLRVSTKVFFWMTHSLWHVYLFRLSVLNFWPVCWKTSSIAVVSGTRCENVLFCLWNVLAFCTTPFDMRFLLFATPLVECKNSAVLFSVSCL